MLAPQSRKRRREEVERTPPWGLLDVVPTHTVGFSPALTLANLGTDVEQQWIDLSVVGGGLWFTPSACRDLEVDTPFNSKGLV